MTTAHPPHRLTALDYLRGYFILVIIIDHLYRWPSALVFLTGAGHLWFNAADGFVIVSGLMIGYVRGYKGLKLPFKVVTEKLWRRAYLLYMWLVIATAVYTGIAWLNPSLAGLPHIPIDRYDWQALVIQTLTFQYSYVWINFLYLYAIFLAIAPAIIWLLRRRLAWLVAVLSIGGFILGDVLNIKWLQWQPLFFLPTIAGFYLETIRSWWLQHPARRKIVAAGIYSLAAGLLTASVLITYLLPHEGAIGAIATYFNKDHIHLGAIPVSLVIFTAFVLLFVKLEPFIKRWGDWILMPFGTHSLTVYILHGVMILLISYTVPISDSVVINTCVGIIAVIGTLALLKLPWTTRYLPR